MMRYLTVMPDYTQSCIKDDFDGYLELGELGIPQDFIDEVTEWHSVYREIIPLDDASRKSVMEQIDELDKQGLEIAKRLQTIIPGEAKVKYFSEGKLEYLPV
jgi:hypothetical protein